MPSKKLDDRVFQLGEWRVQPSVGRISNSTGEVQLEPRAMELLVFLAENAGEVVSRQQLLDAVWQKEFVSDATVSGIIAKLRKAFGDDARSPRYIETLSKRGYRLLSRPLDVLEVAAQPGGAFRIGDWLVEPSRNRLSRGDTTVELERSIMDLLLVLAERAGEPVSPRELVDRVWRTESVPDRTVGHRIAELRDALGDGGGNPGYIETVPDARLPAGGGGRVHRAARDRHPVSRHSRPCRIATPTPASPRSPRPTPRSSSAARPRPAPCGAGSRAAGCSR